MQIRERILRRIARVSCERAWTVIAVFLVLTAGAFAVIALRGKLSTDLSDILPRGLKEAKLLEEVTGSFAGDLLLIAIEADDPADLKAAEPYVARLAEKLRADTAHVRAVEHEVGEKARRFVKQIVEERMYVFLDEEDRRKFAKKISPDAIREQMKEAAAFFDAGADGKGA